MGSKLVEKVIAMPGFKCPFCGEIMSITRATYQTRYISFDSINFDHHRCPCLAVLMYKCPNEKCEKETVFVEGLNGYIANSAVPVYPRAIYTQFPDYVPAAIRADYEEACAIIDSSPKAAATLARRCLQGMIRDFWDIQKKSLFEEITALKGEVPPAQWKAIDAVRNIGNIGAHMEKDVNLIIDVDVDEAKQLIRLIEHLIDKWYVDRHETEELYNDVIAIGDEKKAAKRQDTPADH